MGQNKAKKLRLPTYSSKKKGKDGVNENDKKEKANEDERNNTNIVHCAVPSGKGT